MDMIVVDECFGGCNSPNTPTRNTSTIDFRRREFMSSTPTDVHDCDVRRTEGHDISNCAARPVLQVQRLEGRISSGIVRTTDYS
mmetsp:Transcript_35483/g.76727  ORF Transcript_35483/g.76727 Transcript_35483/m.76727 type:complete len:84 (+) Transcript_35483:55-306(+)